MEQLVECRCCCERDVVAGKMEEYDQEQGQSITCITQHPGFASVCLDRYVLETAFCQYRQEHGGPQFQQDE